MIVVALLALVGGVLAAWFESPDFRAQLKASVSQVPARFTELYFTDYRTLPTQARVGQSTNLPYTVVNHLGRSNRYQLRVTIQEPARTRTYSQEMTVADGAQGFGTASFLPEAVGTYTVQVALSNGQDIHWAVTVGPPSQSSS